MAESVYSRTLRKAAELIGGNAKLCRHLRVPAEELQKWLEDRAAPPIGVFLRAVDLILEETAPSGGSEPAEPASPRDCSPAEGSVSRY
ncbi:MAG: hypothetical protein ACM30H_08345 [Clostridia bacterium]